MKNRYLTKRALQRRLWHIPLGLFSLLLAVIAAEVWVEDVPGAEGILIWALAHLTVFALMALPLYFILRWRLRQRNARIIAGKLVERQEPAIPMSKLAHMLGVRRADAKVTDLMRLGFLQRVEVEDGVLLLDNAESPEADMAQERPDDVILQIRQLNDEIDDAVVSAHIERIERITADILRTLREHPNRADNARRFMNYYLPTTLKLLESYRLMEKQSYQGKNIQASRQRIEIVMEKLVKAAEHQQDDLFNAEAMDVEAEIRVLETMMTSDGLIQTGVTTKNQR